MDPRRKKIYIALIVGCLTLSVLILSWSYLGSPGTGGDHAYDGTVPSIFPQDTTDPGSLGNATTGYSAPTVFPTNEKFKTDILGSSAFKKLKSYPTLNVNGQLGRPDPFRSY